MKLVLCAHGFPPELRGGTELSAHALACGLAEAGHDVIVVAGSLEGAEVRALAVRTEWVEVAGSGSLRIERWTRPDLFFDHWHKSKSARVGAAFRELLQREQPHLVHVLHGLRLTRDLVLIAAQEEIPVVLSLADSWMSCLLTMRVKPESGSICEDSFSASNCIACAGAAAPKTPWVSLEAGYMEFATREAEIRTTLDLAQICLLPSLAFAEQQKRALLDSGVEIVGEIVAPCGVPVRRSERPPLAWSAGETLRIGAWGLLSRLKGTDLIFEAIAALLRPDRVELILAGEESEPALLAELHSRFPSVNMSTHGAYQASELVDHPVSKVHLMLSASRAPESFGIVLEEARALGLPSVLPRAGAFEERSGEDRGSLLFNSGDALALRDCLQRCLDEPGLLAKLRRHLPPPMLREEVLAKHVRIYEGVLSHPKTVKPATHEWYLDRMATFAEEEWDRSLSSCSPEKLGFDSNLPE